MTLLRSATAGVIDAARRILASPAAWPDPPSGFASRLLQAAAMPLPAAYLYPLMAAGEQILRRTPDLAAFGYLIDRADAQTQAAWCQAFQRLRGREVFPPDRNAFIHSPLELIGIAFGLRDHPQVDDTQRRWLIDVIRLGAANREFLTPVSRASAVVASRLLEDGDTTIQTEDFAALLPEMPLPDLVLIGALVLLAPAGAVVDLPTVETVFSTRILIEGVAVRDAAEAAGVLILLERAVGRTTTAVGGDPAQLVTGLCRRFPLFVERLQSRQRGRIPIEVKDEYDVQDLLHAILKLHFDDVRPEEWTPSYAGNASRVDFLLPAERILVEAKMTRASLGQREVVDQLIIDCARYEKELHVDHLVCVVYDPLRRCTNPAAVENDLGRSTGRLRVTVVVCPRGA